MAEEIKDTTIQAQNSETPDEVDPDIEERIFDGETILWNKRLGGPIVSLVNPKDDGGHLAKVAEHLQAEADRLEKAAEQFQAKVTPLMKVTETASDTDQSEGELSARKGRKTK